MTATVLDNLRELRRCLLSTNGMLDAICSDMPPGANAPTEPVRRTNQEQA